MDDMICFYKYTNFYDPKYHAIEGKSSYIVMTPGRAIEAWKTDDQRGITLHSSIPQQPGQRPTTSFCPLLAGGVCYHHTSQEAFIYVAAAFDHDPENLYTVLQDLLTNRHHGGFVTFR